MDLQKRVNNGLALTANLSTLNPELPFTEIVRQEFVDDSLQQARLVMVWRVPGLNQLNQTYELDVLGRFSMVARLVLGATGGAFLFPKSVSNMTQRLQGTFIFQLSYQWKIWRQWKPRSQHTHYPDRTGYRGRACPYPHK